MFLSGLAVVLGFIVAAILWISAYALSYGDATAKRIDKSVSHKKTAAALKLLVDSGMLIVGIAAFAALFAATHSVANQQHEWANAEAHAQLTDEQFKALAIPVFKPKHDQEFGSITVNRGGEKELLQFVWEDGQPSIKSYS